jgi:hypothetical protein
MVLNHSSSFHQKYYGTGVNNGFDALNSNGLPGSSGYPINLRKVTVINGSNDGIETGSAGLEVGFIQASAPLNILAFDLHLRFMPAFGGTNRTFEGYNLSKVGGKLPGWNFVINTTSSTTTPTNNTSLFRWHQTFDINYVFYPINPLNLPFFWKYYFHDKYTKYRSEYTRKNLNPNGSMDAMPGGLITAVGDLLDSNILKVLNSLKQAGTIDKINSSFVFPNSCFIPSVSALGFKNTNFVWNQKFSNRNLLCAPNGSEIYFDNYYAPKQNQEHVSITDDSYAWVIEEIQRGKKGTNCMNICDPSSNPTLYTLTGELNPCSGNTYTYTINPSLPAGTSFNTLLPSGAGYAYGASANSFVLHFNTDSKPQYAGMSTVPLTLEARIQNNCGGEFISVKLNVKVFSTASFTPTPYITLKPDLTQACKYNAFAVWHPCATYEWYNVYPFQSTPPMPTVTTTNICPFGPYSPSTGTKYIWVRIKTPSASSPIFHRSFNITNSCDPANPTAWAAVFATEKPDRSGGNSTTITSEEEEAPPTFNENGIVAFPNPSNTVWNISFEKMPQGKFSYILYDVSGKIVQRKIIEKLNANSFTIDCNQLSKGSFILSVITDEKIYKYKLIKY